MMACDDGVPDFLGRHALGIHLIRFDGFSHADVAFFGVVAGITIVQ